jgi:hypothetical protein
VQSEDLVSNIRWFSPNGDLIPQDERYTVLATHKNSSERSDQILQKYNCLPEHSNLNWPPDISSHVKGKNDKTIKEISYGT